uniref:Uncharacterized protein n=1 Tax=Grammatophora oceanica TaxID=210454 RepID=A0A7S1UZH3_9STRA
MEKGGKGVGKGTGDSAFEVVRHTSLPFFKGHPVHAVIRDTETGQTYNWNARNHRKMRFPDEIVDAAADQESSEHCCRMHFFSWEPHIISWWVAWIGFWANTLWVVNGIFATWPEVNEEYALEISYGTGVAGAFCFIVTAYLGCVEVINQNHTDVVLTTFEQEESSPETRREFKRASLLYGQRRSPLEHGNHGLDESRNRTVIRACGYPIVADHETGKIITQDDPSEDFVGKEIDIVIGNHIVQATVSTCTEIDQQNQHQQQSSDEKALVPHLSSAKHYEWWSWNPDWTHVSVWGAYIFFVSTIMFFVPAAMWYPYDEGDNTNVVVSVLFVDMFQVVPSVGFVIVGHIAMAEASGTWGCGRSVYSSIGWYVGAFNTLGGWGFMLCGIFAIPASADAGCCPSLIKWASGFSTFWGSCFFWIAGVLQCVEFANKYPISFLGRGSNKMNMFKE